MMMIKVKNMHLKPSEQSTADAFLSFVVWLSQSYSRQASTFYSVQHVFVFSFVFQEATLFVVVVILLSLGTLKRHVWSPQVGVGM